MITRNTASSDRPALDVAASVSCWASPMTTPPASAAGSEVNTPRAAAPRASSKKLRSQRGGRERRLRRALEDRGDGRQRAGDAPRDRRHAGGGDPGEPRRVRIGCRGADHLPEQREAEERGQGDDQDRDQEQDHDVGAAQDHAADVDAGMERDRVPLGDQLHRARSERRDDGKGQQELGDANGDEQERDRRRAFGPHRPDDPAVGGHRDRGADRDAYETRQPPTPAPVENHLRQQLRRTARRAARAPG